VPSGFSGVLAVSAAELLTVLLWRWRWFRAGLALAAGTLLAWSLAGVLAGVGGPVGPT
jgi:competence protein ComEC